MGWSRSLRARRRVACVVAGAALAAGATAAGLCAGSALAAGPADSLPTLSLPIPTLAVPSPSLPAILPTATPSLPGIPALPSTPLPSSAVSTGSGCPVGLDQTCPLSGSGAPAAPSTPGLPGLPTPTPGVCVGGVACVNPGCLTAGTPGCAVTTPAPPPPSTPRPAPASGAGSTAAGGAAPIGGGGPGSGPSGPGAAAAGTIVIGGGTATQPVSPVQPASAVDLRAVPVVQQLGVLPGLSFGHVGLLIPLFVLVDVLAVVLLVAVVRRSWGAPAAE